MLKAQHANTSGLHATGSLTLLGSPPSSDHFVQIMNLGRDNWITISNIYSDHSTVLIYDSLTPCSNSLFHAHIASFVNHLSSSLQIKLEWPNVQRQTGGNDCGLFAIATATKLCAGQDPSLAKYNQWQHSTTAY